MSDTVASALLVYTALQIVLTLGAMRGRAGSVLPYLALIILAGAVLPACRRFERRWSRLDDAQARDPARGALFRRDRLMLWTAAVGVPFVVAGGFHLLAAIVA